MIGNQGRSARVRPYAITRGRTRSRYPLLLETLVSVPHYDPSACTDLLPECQEIYALCREVRSIAEISAHLRMPLGVVRVLVSDLAEQGKVRVHSTAHGTDRPGLDLLGRVLRGLQTLPR